MNPQPAAATVNPDSQDSDEEVSMVPEYPHSDDGSAEVAVEENADSPVVPLTWFDSPSDSADTLQLAIDSMQDILCTLVMAATTETEAALHADADMPALANVIVNHFQHDGPVGTSERRTQLNQGKECRRNGGKEGSNVQCTGSKRTLETPTKLLNTARGE